MEMGRYQHGLYSGFASYIEGQRLNLDDCRPIDQSDTLHPREDDL
jgi:hypothetical protein